MKVFEEYLSRPGAASLRFEGEDLYTRGVGRSPQMLLKIFDNLSMNNGHSIVSEIVIRTKTVTIVKSISISLCSAHRRTVGSKSPEA